MNLKISLLQILPTATVAGNLSKGVLCCRMAKALGADVALFPEMWSIGYRIHISGSRVRRTEKYVAPV